MYYHNDSMANRCQTAANKLRQQLANGCGGYAGDQQTLRRLETAASVYRGERDMRGNEEALKTATVICSKDFYR